MSRLDLYDKFNMNCVNTEDCSKCKCCDDETGDLILCALMFGYEQGRADKYQEITSEYMLLTEKQVAEIRADAIEECIKLVGGNIKTIVGVVFDKSIPMHDRALGRMAKNKLIEELVEQLEQLKEQK